MDPRPLVHYTNHNARVPFDMRARLRYPHKRLLGIKASGIRLLTVPPVLCQDRPHMTDKHGCRTHKINRRPRISNHRPSVLQDYHRKSLTTIKLAPCQQNRHPVITDHLGFHSPNRQSKSHHHRPSICLMAPLLCRSRQIARQIYPRPLFLQIPKKICSYVL